MKIAVITMTSPKRHKLFAITYPNMQTYCERHGYDYMVVWVDDDKWEYEKHEAIDELFASGYDLIWYRDDDLLITNLSVPIESFIDDEHYFYITKDFNELNGGSVIIKNQTGGHWINQLILDAKEEYENEQNCINDSMRSAEFRSLVKVLPQRTINSYRYDLYPECHEYVGRYDLGDWEEGKSFVLHIPALSLERRIEILKNTPIIK